MVIFCITVTSSKRTGFGFLTTEYANGVIPILRYASFASPKSGVPTYLNGTESIDRSVCAKIPIGEGFICY